MTTIGRRFRDARQLAGITIEQVCAATKLSKHIVELIEHDRFEDLPGGILTRGYIRAYAAVIHVEAEPIVREYLTDAFGTAGETLPIAPRPSLEEPERIWRRLASLTAILLIAAAYFSYRRSRESPAAAPPTAAVRVSPVNVRSLDDISTGLALRDEQEEWPMRLDIQPSGPCWVAATADGEVVLRRLLRQGDRVVVTAKTSVLLHIGDPGTFVYRLNGAPGRRLGSPAVPASAQINKDNFENFLAE